MAEGEKNEKAQDAARVRIETEQKKAATEKAALEAENTKFVAKVDAAQKKAASEKAALEAENTKLAAKVAGGEKKFALLVKEKEEGERKEKALEAARVDAEAELLRTGAEKAQLAAKVCVREG